MKHVSSAEALRLGDAVGIDFGKVSLEVFRLALEVEVARTPFVDDDELAAHIAKEKLRDRGLGISS